MPPRGASILGRAAPDPTNARAGTCYAPKTRQRHTFFMINKRYFNITKRKHKPPSPPKSAAAVPEPAPPGPGGPAPAAGGGAETYHAQPDTKTANEVVDA